MLTQPRDFDKVFEWMLDLLHAKIEPVTLNEKAIASTAENGLSLMYIEFKHNTQAQGAIIGLGKEPDVPFTNMKSEVINVAATHYKLNLEPETVFVLSQEEIHGKKYFYVTGGKNPTLIVEPHMETYRMEVERNVKGRITAVHQQKKMGVLFTEHVGFIRAYLGK